MSAPTTLESMLRERAEHLAASIGPRYHPVGLAYMPDDELDDRPFRLTARIARAGKRKKVVECRDIHGWGETIDAAADGLRDEIEAWRAQGWELDG